ncbi:hypothetical protein [Legionella maioricensis]|uniref:Lipoprotein n=1 Tax=Legionella maioricensis TaxID=2896528 RepID=A0A9X2D2A1_9GAMM|nr:hypothetical protein [Legionella maioricensis]MCL9684903.1 hypothetical protein [Legionella maioricensis]MCL9688265.1 hypothetical protein [Legionella maioricensis]
MLKIYLSIFILILAGCTTTQAKKEAEPICFKPSCATKAEDFFPPIYISTQNKVFQEMN